MPATGSMGFAKAVDRFISAAFARPVGRALSL